MNEKRNLMQTIENADKKSSSDTVITASKLSNNIISEIWGMSSENNQFLKLYEVNVNEHVEKKNNLSYLSWTYAIAEAKKRYPTLTYKIHLFGEKQLPYVYDENTGYMVFTDVTIEGLTHSMWLPVMDSSNKAMKNKTYTYDTRYKKGIVVEAATMFDINKTIMRCLVENLAMFGLGLYIYAGEDLPKTQEEIRETKEKKKNIADIETVNLLISEIEKFNGQAEKLKLGILAKYKVNELSELAEEQAKEAIDKLQNFKNKEGKSNAK